MRPIKLLHLVRGNLFRQVSAVVVAASGVALGIGCLVFFLALGAGVRGVVADVFPVSTREVEVVVPQMSVGSLLGEQKLDEATLDRLRRLRGVEAVYPKMAMRFPSVTKYNGLFFGREIHMGLEIVAVGLPPELVAADVRQPFVDRGEGQPVPALVNRRLLELYNKVFAPQRGLPRLTDSMLIGFQIPAELGRSWVAGKSVANPEASALQLVGFSDRATLAGVAMPLAAVKRLNAKFGLDAETYTSVLLRADHSDRVVEVAAAVKRMGFEIDESERTRALQISSAVELVTLALSLLAALITALAAVNTAQTFYAQVRERTRELGILRAVGATRTDVAAVVLAEAGVTGLLGGVAGVVLARAVAALLDHASKSALPDFPFKPPTFFHFEARQVLLGLVVAFLASVVGAFFPARAAAGLDPAKALTET